MVSSILLVLLGAVLALGGGYYWLKYGFPWENRATFSGFQEHMQARNDLNLKFFQKVKASPDWVYINREGPYPDQTLIYYNEKFQEIAIFRYSVGKQPGEHVYAAGVWRMTMVDERNSVIAYMELCLRMAGVTSKNTITVSMPFSDKKSAMMSTFVEPITDPRTLSQLRLLMTKFRQTLNWNV